MGRPSLERWTTRLPLLAELAVAGDPVVVGCSGGADSLALLALVAAAGIPAVAVYIDHQLRDGSDADFDVVEAVATQLGLRATMGRVAVASGPNLEGRARDARYAALDDARVHAGAAAVLVGHTADDQAETVLLNMLRGAATAGLAAMAERHGTVVRPILSLRRHDTLEICRRSGFAPVVDPMNADSRFRRVWLRREVLPTLEAGAGRDLRSLLARQADVMRDESDLLDALAHDALVDAGDPPLAAHVAALPAALARRALRQWLGGLPPSLAATDAVREVAAGARRAAQLPGGRAVERRHGHLYLIDRAAADEPDPASPPCEFALPGSVAALGLELETWIEKAPPVAWPDGLETCVVDADTVGDHAWLRSAGPGERFAPLGLRGTKPVNAVSDHGRVVATAPSSGVVWVVGYRIDDHARVTSRTRRFLWMTVSASVPA